MSFQMLLQGLRKYKHIFSNLYLFFWDYPFVLHT
jgi:hypothetical protein